MLVVAVPHPVAAARGYVWRSPCSGMRFRHCPKEISPAKQGEEYGTC